MENLSPKNADYGTFVFDDREYSFRKRGGRFLLRLQESETRGFKIYLRRDEKCWLPTEIYHFRPRIHRKNRLGRFAVWEYVDEMTSIALTRACNGYSPISTAEKV